MHIQRRFGFAVFSAYALAIAACGEQQTPLSGDDGNIIGGTTAPDSDEVAQFTVTVQGAHGFCTGTLIDDQFVLTAASCVSNSPTFITFGSNALKPHFKRTIVQTITHPGFDASMFKDDIALVRFIGSIPSGHRPVELTIVEGQLYQEVILAGFGVSSTTTPDAGTLRRTTAQLVAQDSNKHTIYTQQHGNTACYGDGGAPALSVVDGRMVMIGMANAISAQCSGTTQMIDLRFYIDWMREQGVREASTFATVLKSSIAAPTGGNFAAVGFQRFVTDVNGDGKADIVFIYADSTARAASAQSFVALGDGNGGFSTFVHSTIGAVHGGAYARPTLRRYLSDVNGDGLKDIVFIAGGSIARADAAQAFVGLANADGTYQKLVQHNLAGRTGGTFNQAGMHYLLGDLNGDGRSDILFLLPRTLRNANAVEAWVSLAGPDGSFGTFVQSSLAGMGGGGFGAPGFATFLADVNSDRLADVVITYGANTAGANAAQTYVALSQGNGAFGALVPSMIAPPTGGNFSAASFSRHIADVNADGSADLLFVFGANATNAGSARVYVSLANRDGTFAPFLASSIATPAGGTFGAASMQRFIGDVNGDGKSDVVFTYGVNGTTEGAAQTWVSLSKGDGTFGTFAQSSIAPAPPNPNVHALSSATQPTTPGGPFGGMQRFFADLSGSGRSSVVFVRSLQLANVNAVTTYSSLPKAPLTLSDAAYTHHFDGRLFLCSPRGWSSTMTIKKGSDGQYSGHVTYTNPFTGIPQSHDYTFSHDDMQLLVVSPGAGNDQIMIDESVDVPIYVAGGDGDDIIDVRASGGVRIDAGNGDDVIINRGNGSIIAGAAGKDLIINWANGSTLLGGDDDDILWSSGSNNQVVAGWGNDQITSFGDGNFLFGGDITIPMLYTATPIPSSGPGSVTIDQEGNNGTITGGPGNDTISVLGSNNSVTDPTGQNAVDTDGVNNNVDNTGGNNNVHATNSGNMPPAPPLPPTTFAFPDPDDEAKREAALRLLAEGDAASNKAQKEKFAALQDLADQADEEGIAFRALNAFDVRHFLEGLDITARGSDKTSTSFLATIVNDGSQAYLTSGYMPTTSAPPYLIDAQGRGSTYVAFDTAKVQFTSRVATFERLKQLQPDYKAAQYTNPVAHSIVSDKISKSSVLVVEFGSSSGYLQTTDDAAAGVNDVQRYSGTEIKDLVGRVQILDEAYAQADGTISLQNERGEQKIIDPTKVTGLSTDFVSNIASSPTRYRFYYDPVRDRVIASFDMQAH